MWFKSFEHFHYITDHGRTDGQTHTAILVHTCGLCNFLNCFLLYSIVSQHKKQVTANYQSTTLKTYIQDYKLLSKKVLIFSSQTATLLKDPQKIIFQCKERDFKAQKVDNNVWSSD